MQKGVDLAQRGWLWQSVQWPQSAPQLFAVSCGGPQAEARVHRCGASAPDPQRSL